MTRTTLKVTLLSLIALAACAGTDPAPGGSGTAAAAQVERGQQVFSQSCAKCHGPAGQGTDKAPALVGPGTLPLDPPAGRKFRKSRFRTALDVAQFVVPNMPPPPAPRLAGPDAWAVLAFALTANGKKLTEPVGPDNAGSIVLH